MKYALIIGNNKYDDQKLAQLKTPAADSQALAKILGETTIGSFDEVTPLINQAETKVRRAISAFLTNKKPDDLVLLYFSGHGILDDRGRLYLALKDTQVNLLKATSIPSSFITDEMDSCRSKRQILILDCCHSGAFARGAKGEQKAITETTFEGRGFGRVVLTASDSTQYALEGDQVIKQTELSLFTHFLLEGLKTGAADTNNDGQVSLDEWYDYTYARVISETPRQVPHKWSYNQQGDVIIAKNPHMKKRIVELPYELIQALESSFVGIRENAVTELGKYLRSSDSQMVELAISSLERMKQDDSRRISSLAEKLLTDFEQARNPGKMAASKPVQETVSVAAVSPSDDPLTSLRIGEVKAAEAMQSSQSTAEKIKPAPSSQDQISDRSFLPKWIGCTVLAIVLSLILYNYDQSSGFVSNTPAGVVVAVFTGFLSTIQWFVFRNRLNGWWIVANIGIGAVLGALHYHLFNNSSWGKEHLLILLAVWLISNFALGRTFIGETGEESKNSSPLVRAGGNRGLFFRFLSVFLAFYAFRMLMVVLYESGIINPPDWLQNSSWTLYGIISIVAGVSFFLLEKRPWNLGLISLAIFMLLNGIFVLIFGFFPDTSITYFVLPGILALFTGIYFLFQRQTLKDVGLLILSTCLISIALAYCLTFDSFVNRTLLGVSVIFAIPAAILFFLRK